MRSVRLLLVAVIALVGGPITAQVVTKVPCSVTALRQAIDDANLAKGGTLALDGGVRRARLPYVRAPQNQEAGIVPVGRFRHIGLLAPCLR